MEDSSQFMQWALSTLQHEQPAPSTPAPAAAYDSAIPVLGYAASSVDSLVPGEPPSQEGQLAINSWSSVDADSAAVAASAWAPPQHPGMCATAPGSCSGGTNQPLGSDFNSAQLINEAHHQPNSAAAAIDSGVPQMTTQNGSPTTRRASARIPASSSSAVNSQDHIIAERKRREKINQRFIELSTVIPGLKKMDKATILSDATRYVRELQEKVKARQQEGSGGRGMESAVLVKRPCIVAVVDDDDEDGGAPSYAAATSRNALPEIEARISEGNVVMLRIHYQDAKGVLVRVLAEVEGLHLTITHANVVQFSASVLIINIIAKVEDGFNTTADDIVRRLSAVLHPAAC